MENKPIEQSSRLYLLDALKGIMLFIITLNHIKGNPIRWITYEPFGFFGAAEGYVFISGLLVGYIYGRESLGKSQLANKIGDRVFLIGVSWLVIIASTQLLDLFLNGYRITDISLDLFVLPNLLGGYEILGLYFTLFLIIYPILLLLRIGRIYTLFLISLSVYFIAHIPTIYKYQIASFLHSETNDVIVRCILFATGNVPTPTGDPYQGYQPAGVSLIAWQLLFVIAAALGFCHRRGKLLSCLKSKWTLPTAIAICVSFLFLKYSDVNLWAIRDLTLKRENLGILRLISFCSFSLLIFSLINKLKKPPRLHLLEIVGRNSLPAYVFQTVLIFGIINHYTSSIQNTNIFIFLLIIVCFSVFAVAKVFDIKRQNSRIRSNDTPLWKQYLGIPSQLDWRRKFAITTALAYLLANGINLANLREDYPFTSAAMFARYIGPDTSLYSIEIYKNEIEASNRLLFSDYRISTRILFYSIYCSDEPETPYYNPSSLEEAYKTRLKRWFNHFATRYLRQHGHLPKQFTLALQPRQPKQGQVIIGTYVCSTSDLLTWNKTK